MNDPRLLTMLISGILFTAGFSIHLLAQKIGKFTYGIRKSLGLYSGMNSTGSEPFLLGISAHPHLMNKLYDFSELSSDAESRSKAHWGNLHYTEYRPRLSQIWRNGGAGLALAYDLLYNDMTAAQQAHIGTGLVVAHHHAV